MAKKKIFFVLACVFLLAGCNNVKLTNGENAVVTFTEGGISSDELYNSYVMQLDALKVKGHQNIMKDFENIDVKITNITEESGIVNVTVYLHTAMYDYVVDNNKKTVRGKDNHKIDIEYSITFVKASDESKQKCPNCGAPFEGVAGGKCEYCGSTIVIGPKEYVMSKKTCIGQRMR